MPCRSSLHLVPCAGRLRSGVSLRFGRRHLGGLLLGGAIIIASFLLNAGLVLEGGTPSEFAWPIFHAGLAIGVAAAWVSLQPTVSQERG